MTVLDFAKIRDEISPDQVLKHFGHKVPYNSKVVCPFHHETEPSMVLYEHDVYCFGCKRYFDVPGLAKALLEKSQGHEVAYGEVFQWFATTTLPTKMDRRIETGGYTGPVPQEFITYWDNQMTDELYGKLYEQRLISKTTAQRYKLGWRPDWKAWTIPFWRGLPGESAADIVQFRLTEGTTKYLGLRGHNRGSIQNAHLLSVKQPYVVILFGSYDAILALQDGVIAVGFNGSMPFRKSEYPRLKELFAKQDNIYVVPDNTPQEFKCAYVFEQVLNARVRAFPHDSVPGCDYIDYRKVGYDAFDFCQSILCLNMPKELVENVDELLKVGDPYNLARYHALYAARVSHSPTMVAQDIVLSGPQDFSPQAWGEITAPLLKVATEDDLFAGVEQAAQLAYYYKGGW